MTAPANAGNQFLYLDGILEQVCLDVQLTSAQYEDATKKYGSIGRWLADPSSPLTRYGPDIYPQGSMRLGTTIRPWRGEEFDLDVVCQLNGCDGQPASHIYELVARRLRDHGTYRLILEAKNRCLRINYAGNFHLDIIPACPLSGTAIKVPDRELATWMSSNPIGYGEWFFSRCQYRKLLEKRAFDASISPLPSQVPAEYKHPLQRAVQLLKRHRDSFFDGNPNAARSILITTLAAQAYDGDQSLTLALDGIIDGIRAFIARVPGIPRVPNPTNPQENFAAGWNAETYPQFVRYAQSLRQHLDRLMAGDGIDEMAKSLGGFVGKPLAERVVLEKARETQQLRNKRELHMEPSKGSSPPRRGLRFRATASTAHDKSRPHPKRPRARGMDASVPPFL